jgi:hypothetical protein
LIAFRLQFNRDLFTSLNVHVFVSYNTTSRHILKCICIHRPFILADKYRLSLLSAAVIFCHESGSSRFSYIFSGNVQLFYFIYLKKELETWFNILQLMLGFY